MTNNNEMIAPVNHSAGSALGRTTAGAAGGALKTGVVAGLSWPLVTAVAGGILGALVVGFFTGGASLALTPVMWGGLIGAGAGLVGGGLTALPAAGVGAAVGAFTGGAKATNRVNEERGAAAVVDAQIAMARAQNPAPAATTIYAPTANNSARIGAQPGERGNRVTETQVHGAQYQGTVHGQQLAAAR